MGVRNIRQETAANNNDLYSAVIICDVPINSTPLDPKLGADICY